MRRPFKKPDQLPKPEKPVPRQATADEVRAVLEPLRKSFEITKVGYVGNGWYQIGEGIYTGQAGWDLFNKALKEEATNLSKDATDKL